MPEKPMIYLVMPPKWKISYYVTSSGDNPIKNFLDRDPRVKAKAFRIFQHIIEFGLTSANPYIKKLTETPLWEIRILGRENIRIFFVAQTQKSVMLLHIFTKKTQKTPAREIKTALNRLKQIPT